jgi:hypothetical protein
MVHTVTIGRYMFNIFCPSIDYTIYYDIQIFLTYNSILDKHSSTVMISP